MQVTRIELPQPPNDVQRCLQALRAAGGSAWLVGGAVRDLLLGLPVEDFDIATDLRPEQVAAALPGAALREAALGTSRVTSGDRELTITTLRRETGYADQRHPDAVEFVDDVAVDARRRDFTVNALYFDPERGELLDAVGGREDLEQRALRAIGPAEQRMREDPLRLLRLVRFAASCGLTVAPDLAAAARACAAEQRTLSAERVFGELTRAFCGPGRGRALRLFVDLGLAAVLLPEVAAMHDVPQPPEYHPEGDVLTHVCLVLDHVPAAHPVLAWSAVLHDVGKPPTFREAEDRIRFDGHDTLSAEMAEAILTRLAAPRALRERVVDVCLQHIRFAALPQMRPARAERFLRSPWFADHLAFHRADCLGSHGKLDIHEFASRRLAELPPLREPLLAGRDVLALGVPAGPQVGALLRDVQERIDEAPTATTRDDALVLLRDAVERLRQGRPSDAR